MKSNQKIINLERGLAPQLIMENKTFNFVPSQRVNISLCFTYEITQTILTINQKCYIMLSCTEDN